MRAALLARDIRPAVRRLQPGAFEAAGPTIDQLRVEHEIRLLEARRSSVASDLQAYREKYGVVREADLKEPSDRRLRLGWVILVALVQALANAAFFASGSRWGLSFGLGLAVMLGVADVVAHVHLGRGIGLIAGARWVDRVLGVLLLGVVVITVPAWNLGVVHLRNVVRTLGFESGIEQWLPSLLESPLGFTDFMSWALLTIGITCSVSAVLAGWSWNERDPTLRRLSGRLAELDADLDELRWDAQEMADDHRSLTDAERTELRDQILADLEMSESLVARMRRLEANRDTFLHDAKAAHAAMVRAYRDENRLVRGTPPPRYFTEQAELGPILEVDPFNLQELSTILEDQKSLARSVPELEREVLE